MPGNTLQVVIGMRNGKVLVWQTLSNYVLTGHTKHITHCVGFYSGDSAGSGVGDGDDGYDSFISCFP